MSGEKSSAKNVTKSGGWSIKAVVVVVLTIQNASVPLLMRYARTSGLASAEPYCVPLLVLLTETLKLFASFGLLAREVGPTKVFTAINDGNPS
mmetsp:Transcript_30231/g.48461  ORF Transcript_30231/g.48461 Transcript_30231/m.48461 type:complete len:93 (-) Transcript_30231:20-298(-)